MRKVLACTAALAGALVMLAGAAAPASSAVASVRPSFAAQARGAGLTRAQAGTLQREVNSFIAKHGGTQAAINEVKFRGGDIVFAAPGQKYAHVVTGRSTAAVLSSPEKCPYENFCIYQGTHFTGTYANYFYCNIYNPILKLFTGTGSWKNNQIAGVKAYFYGPTVNLIYTTAAAYSNNANYNWTPVYYVEACK